MTIKRCKECGNIVHKDRPSGQWWCDRCKEIRGEYSEGYKIVVLGKNAGKQIGYHNFIVCIARELRLLGHEVIEVSIDELYKIVPNYDFINCFHHKKPINIREIEYIHNPDFIYIEQTYNRLDVSEVKCPVIYQHREYTHFPDVIDPDILLASYYWRLRIFEMYLPWEYKNIPYKDYNLIAVDEDRVPPIEEKTLEGIQHIGLAIPMWQFRQANGMFGDMVMDDQEKFSDECVDKGYVGHIPTGLDRDEFITMLGRCEAILLDAGRFGGLTRRVFEAMASKTLCVIRVHTKKMEELFKEKGLTDEMCFFVKTPEEVGKIKFTEKQRKEMVDKAYKWVIKNHTYEVRAKEFIEKFEEFKSGVKKDIGFMGWATTKKILLSRGGVIVDT